jgi:hypothetical protein
MDREGAETHLRLLAEATMRRSLEAAREKPGPSDPGGHRAKLMAVGQTLVAVGALDAVTLETLLVDFNLAMNVRQLSASQEPGPGGTGVSEAARVARLVGQFPHQMQMTWGVRPGLGRPPGGTAPGPGPGPAGPAASQAAGTGPDDVAADRLVPVGLKVPFRHGDICGELYLMAFVRTSAGPRFFSVWSIRPPALQDAAMLPLGAFTATDDRGTRYRLDFPPGGYSGWTTEIGLQPAPPPGVRRLVVTPPGHPAVSIDLDAVGPADSADQADPGEPLPPRACAPQVRAVQQSPGEVLLVMLAERLLTAMPDQPRHPWRGTIAVVPPALRGMAAWLGDIVAALEAADVLSPLSPVPARLATLCVSLDIPGHGITVSPTPHLPEPWLSVLAHYQRRKPEPVPLLEGYAAMAAALPELNGIQLTLLGLHHNDGDSSLHVLVRGQVPEAYLGPFGIDPAFPLSVWLRDSGGRWHVARPAGRHRGELKDGEWTMRLQLVPPLTRATPWAEVLARGQSGEVRTRLPLRWGYPS